MSLPQATQLKSRVIKTENVDWRSFQYIQQDNFKDLPDEAMVRLKASILSNNFTQPFYVWEDDSGVTWCLDGRHRTKALEQLVEEKFDIPYLLPATFIDCGNKKEASKLVLIYSSIYAKITQQGLFDFIEAYELNYSELKEQMDLPEFSEDRFEQKFEIFDIEQDEELPTEIPDPVVKQGDVYQLNGHRVFCGTFNDPRHLELLMANSKARILITDPPYNLPANFFSHIHSHDKNFAMAHGEMTDDEFVSFIAEIMTAAKQHTVDGSIHYIFMDWRHVWHMTEAGRRIYGSPEPKQLCVWNKDIIANGSFYRAKQELCFVFNNGAAQHLWNKDLLDHGGFYKDNNELVFIFKAGDDDVKHLSHLELKDRIRSNVWNYPSAVSTANPDRAIVNDHPTPKPVAMIADAILDTTNEKDIVLDFFLGSGTALIAAEQTKRHCYATEIEPRYVQLGITRYLRYCRKKGIAVNFEHVNGDNQVTDFLQHEKEFVH